MLGLQAPPVGQMLALTSLVFNAPGRAQERAALAQGLQGWNSSKFPHPRVQPRCPFTRKKFFLTARMPVICPPIAGNCPCFKLKEMHRLVHVHMYTHTHTHTHTHQGFLWTSALLPRPKQRLFSARSGGVPVMMLRAEASPWYSPWQMFSGAT